MTYKHTPTPQQREAFREWSRGANVGLEREWVLNLAPYYINICEEVFYAGMKAGIKAAEGDA